MYLYGYNTKDIIVLVLLANKYNQYQSAQTNLGFCAVHPQAQRWHVELQYENSIHGKSILVTAEI